MYIGGAGLKRVQNLVSAFNDIYQAGVDEGQASNLCFDDSTNVVVENICLYPRKNMAGWDDWEIVPMWPTEVLDADPGFVSDPDPENDYWGDPHLSDDSILIDAGNQYVDIDPATLGIQFVPDFDLEGNPRIMDGDGDGDGHAEVDIGAYEYSPY